MAQDDYARLAGSTVDLRGTMGVFRACPSCGSRRGAVADGSGPHMASVECFACGRHISWLSRDHLTALAAALGKAA